MLGMSGDQTGGVLLVGLLAVALGAIAAWAGRPGRNLD
jgi:hypothetical protein